LQTVDGVRVIGRDYGFTPVGTGTAVNWCLVGGMPLTPACMPSTALRGFCQMYQKFKFNAINAHYITSSSTSTTGDIMFQHQQNPTASCPNWTSQSFLPYVLSDPLTVIGPQWTNHTVTLQPKSGWKVTDYGTSTDEHEFSQGDLFLYSKTASTDSPGYVVIDYDITFKGLSVNPRSGLLPTIKAQWTPIVLSFSGNLTAFTTVPTIVGTSTSWISTAIITAPTLLAGEVYKIVFDITNATFNNGTAATVLAYQPASGTPTAAQQLALTDGYTLFASVNQAGTLTLYATEAQAYVSEGTSTSIVSGYTNAAADFTIRSYIKLIGSVNPGFQQVQY
jgi:hypothetical protein